MKAEELRIGNETKQGKIISFWESGVHLGMGKTPRFGDLDPIPLTVGWLNKFGFEKDESQMDSPDTPNGNFWPEYFKEGVRIWLPYFEYNHNEINIEIKHVHQLQNLYFALTGEELELKNLRK